MSVKKTGRTVRSSPGFLWVEGTGPLSAADHRGRSCQKATALAAATFRESTSWDMGMRTV